MPWSSTIVLTSTLYKLASNKHEDDLQRALPRETLREAILPCLWSEALSLTTRDQGPPLSPTEKPKGVPTDGSKDFYV